MRCIWSRDCLGWPDLRSLPGQGWQLVSSLIGPWLRSRALIGWPCVRWLADTIVPVTPPIFMATLHARSAKWLNLAPALATQPVSRDQGYQAMSGACQDIRHLETSDTQPGQETLNLALGQLSDARQLQVGEIMRVW